MLPPVFFTNWISLLSSWAEFVRFWVGTLELLTCMLGIVILGIDKLAPLSLMHWQVQRQKMPEMSECSGSETSDSKKLLVLDRDNGNHFTGFSRSTSLLSLETTQINGVAHFSILVFSDLHFKLCSEASALCMMCLVRDSGIQNAIFHWQKLFSCWKPQGYQATIE